MAIKNTSRTWGVELGLHMIVQSDMFCVLSLHGCLNLVVEAN